MTEIRFFTTFRFLTVSQSLITLFQLMPGISISNHDKEKHRFLDRNTERAIGLIEMDHYRHASNIVFGTFQREDMRRLDPERFLVLLR